MTSPEVSFSYMGQTRAPPFDIQTEEIEIPRQKNKFNPMGAELNITSQWHEFGLQNMCTIGRLVESKNGNNEVWINICEMIVHTYAVKAKHAINVTPKSAQAMAPIHSPICMYPKTALLYMVHC